MRPLDSSRTPFLAFPGPIALAHRGGAAYAPNRGLENTRVAFASALALGATHLETDVQASADGVVFVFHDAHLDRLTAVSGALASLPAERVRRARVGGREPIPELRDLLDELPDALLNIDVKADAAVEPTARAIADAGAVDRVCLASFSHRRLARLRALMPGVATSLSPQEIGLLRGGATRGLRATGARAGGRCVQVPPRWGPVPLVDARFVRHAHDLGLPVHVWTVDDAAEMTRLLDLGVDGIVSDRIDVLVPLLAERAAA
ncbi:glycerophosphodiester phosphodiesterase family protein [Solicola sp. PLA-1-18]|uniref:glycerophosphodiester phosphodiesterase family protein n=1 Tax=Solicola sp. PLA-1-18 TaxID=3380532 RepID=UPI003B7EC73A